MKISVLQENLLHAVSIANRFVASKPQTPVLSHFLISGRKGEMVIAATDLNTGIEFSVGARVDVEGAFTVPAKVFSELVNSLPQETVEIELKKDQLQVKCDAYMAQFQGIGAEEFPKFPERKKVKSSKIVVEDMGGAMDRVAFAASSDETRPVLTGVFFDIREKRQAMVATDGYRLSMVEFKGETEGVKLESFLVSAGVFSETMKIFKELQLEKAKISLSAAQRQLFMEGESVRVVTRLLEGEFPAYQKIIPQDNQLIVVMEKEELLQAVKAAAIFARDSANIIKWQFGEGKLKVMANSPQVGENVVVVEAEMVEGETGKIAFNSRYLLDFLSHIEDKKVEFRMSGALQPGVFREKENKRFLHVIMPVRVQEEK